MYVTGVLFHIALDPAAGNKFPDATMRRHKRSPITGQRTDVIVLGKKRGTR